MTYFMRKWLLLSALIVIAMILVGYYGYEYSDELRVFLRQLARAL